DDHRRVRLLGHRLYRWLGIDVPTRHWPDRHVVGLRDWADGGGGVIDGAALPPHPPRNQRQFVRPAPSAPPGDALCPARYRPQLSDPVKRSSPPLPLMIRTVQRVTIFTSGRGVRFRRYRAISRGVPERVLLPPFPSLRNDPAGVSNDH